MQFASPVASCGAGRAPWQALGFAATFTPSIQHTWRLKWLHWPKKNSIAKRGKCFQNLATGTVGRPWTCKSQMSQKVQKNYKRLYCSQRRPFSMWIDLCTRSACAAQITRSCTNTYVLLKRSKTQTPCRFRYVKSMQFSNKSCEILSKLKRSQTAADSKILLSDLQTMKNIEYLLEAGQCMKKTVTQQKQPAVKQPPRKTHQVVRRAWLWRSPGILGEFFEFQVMRVKETKWNKRIRLAVTPYSRKFCCSRYDILSKVWKSFYMFTSCSQGICSQGIASFQDTMM